MLQKRLLWLMFLASCGKDAVPVQGAGTQAPADQAAAATAPESARPEQPNPQTGKPGEQVTLSGTGEKGKLRFSLQFRVPKVGELFAVDVRVTDARSGAAMTAQKVTVDATMPEHGHGMMTAPEHRQTAPGHWRTEGMKLHMHGNWLLAATAELAGETDVLKLPFVQPPEAAAGP